MEYNSTKRKVELAAGIISIISNAICIIMAFFMIMMGFIILTNAGPGWYFFGEEIVSVAPGVILFLTGLFLVVLPTITLIFSAKLLKSPYTESGEIKNKQATRIWVLVLAILSGNLVVMGLMIAALCLKDVSEPKVANTYVPVQPVAQKSSNQTFNDFSAKVQELKRLKDAGIIDQETYKIAIAKITENL